MKKVVLAMAVMVGVSGFYGFASNVKADSVVASRDLLAMRQDTVKKDTTKVEHTMPLAELIGMD